MAYREVGVFEAKEVLRLWSRGLGKKTIAKRVGLDPKTVRTYVDAATDAGVVAGDETSLTEERVGAVLTALTAGGRPRGESWATCVAHRKRIEELLGQTVRLSKVRRLLAREGVALPYSTLHRYAVEELGFGRTAPTLPVADGAAGAELQVDTGWVVTLTEAGGKTRRIRAWIFTPGVSRYRFVWPIERETTESAIEACEAAWSFYGGVFRVLVPDNTKVSSRPAKSCRSLRLRSMRSVGAHKRSQSTRSATTIVCRARRAEARSSARRSRDQFLLPLMKASNSRRPSRFSAGSRDFIKVGIRVTMSWISFASRPA